MILQLRKKRRTTPPNTRLVTSLNQGPEFGRFALCSLVLLLMCQAGLAANGASTLEWGRPKVASRKADVKAAVRPVLRQPHVRVIRDAHVVAAAWEEEERSVIVERSAPAAYDPFDEDDRLAQLPIEPAYDDPFDEPVDESIPEPDDDIDDEDIDTVEDAIEEEMQRRQSADDLFDEEMEGPLQGPLEGDLLEGSPLEEDSLEDLTNPLGEDASDEEMLQPGQEELKTPDLDFDFDREDPVAEDTTDADMLSPEELEEQRKEFAKEQRESEENCRQELLGIEADRISSIDLSIRVKGNAGEDYPFECAVSTKNHQPRQWPQVTYNWKAAALCHKPLYFEQVQLERYGHSWGPYVQPLMSGVHFFGTIPFLPYKMGIRTPNECVYSLGYYRPGSCAPYMIDPISFTWRAAMFEGAAATGISFIIP